MLIVVLPVWRLKRSGKEATYGAKTRQVLIEVPLVERILVELEREDPSVSRSVASGERLKGSGKLPALVALAALAATVTLAALATSEPLSRGALAPAQQPRFPAAHECQNTCRNEGPNTPSRAAPAGPGARARCPWQQLPTRTCANGHSAPAQVATRLW